MKGQGITTSQLEAFCTQLPGATRDVKWGDNVVYSVGGKMFAVTGSETTERLSFKVDRDRFLELSDQPGMIPAPYLARASWIAVTEPKRFARTELEAMLRRSYELVRAGLTKKAQAALGPLGHN
ncbi:MAG TPA: MmcQ/YjbR family DNA-binding protein [Luteibacter sp.]|jgi:predicted DNA-binding protein (MmcQ/YjbR family)|nr:MmcQ/YjbR family DNA-binding protein [Luteibacter sp.]